MKVNNIIDKYVKSSIEAQELGEKIMDEFEKCYNIVYAHRYRNDSYRDRYTINFFADKIGLVYELSSGEYVTEWLPKKIFFNDKELKKYAKETKKQFVESQKAMGNIYVPEDEKAMVAKQFNDMLYGEDNE